MPTKFIDEMARSLRDTIFGYAVHAQDGTRVGTADRLWPNYDDSGYSFVGLRSGRLFRRRHVVSADGMRIDHGTRQVHLPLTKQAIRAAPYWEVTEVDAERAFKGPAAPVIIPAPAAEAPVNGQAVVVEALPENAEIPPSAAVA